MIQETKATIVDIKDKDITLNSLFVFFQFYNYGIIASPIALIKNKSEDYWELTE